MKTFTIKFSFWSEYSGEKVFNTMVLEAFSEQDAINELDIMIDEALDYDIEIITCNKI